MEPGGRGELGLAGAQEAQTVGLGMEGRITEPTLAAHSGEGSGRDGGGRGSVRFPGWAQAMGRAGGTELVRGGSNGIW